MDSITKHLISQDFIDYLEANGFAGSWSEDGRSWSSLANDKRVGIKYDKITFATFHEGDEQTYPDFSEYGSVDGVSQLDFFKFQLVLHAFDIVKLNDFIKRARRELSDLFPGLVSKVSPLESSELFRELPY